MCDIFEVVFTEDTKEPKTLTSASSKSHEFIFTRPVKYLCCFTSTIKINKPFRRSGQGQTSDFKLEWSIITPASKEVILVHISFNISFGPFYIRLKIKSPFKKKVFVRT